MREFNRRVAIVAASLTLMSAVALTSTQSGIKRRISTLFQLPAEPSDVDVIVDGAVIYQTIEGFGQAQPSTLVYPGPKTLSDTLRAAGVDKAFNQVGINLGTIGSLLESPSDYNERQNDNGDPSTINWSGFSTNEINATRQYVVDLAKPFGFTNYFLGAEAPNVRWASPWLAEIRKRNYSAYLDEVAEQVLANVTFWKNTYGEELSYYQLGNEQLSGNTAMINPDLSGYGSVDPVQQMVDITKRSGARLRKAGFLKTRFMVGTEETEEISLKVSTAILSDADARQYAGAIGYHSYPYQEGYSSSSFILRTSGSGRPDAGRLAVRAQLRDLGKKYGVRIWMTENSHGGEPFAYDTFRARAIQIHDEFLYAGASAYFGENSLWDLASQRLHFSNSDLDTTDNEGNIVVINNDTGRVDITGIGYAIGHYSRWVKPGSVRIEAGSSDPLVQVSAFRNDDQARFALILINNAPVSKKLAISVKGLSMAGNLTGEQSAVSTYWKALASFPPASPAALTITLPPTSVTSIGGNASGGANTKARIISAASFSEGLIAQESIATAFVPDLPVDTAAAPGLPLPVNLGGLGLFVQDQTGVSRSAPLFFVSPRQVNFQIPEGTAIGLATASIRINGAGPLASGQVTVSPTAPGVFTANGNGQGVAAAHLQRIRSDGSQSITAVFQCDSTGACRSTPLDLSSSTDQVFLIFYGTGIRKRSGLGNVSLTIGGSACQMLYAGPHSTSPGLDQVNVIPPRLRGPRNLDVVLTVDSQPANTVQIGIQ